jgi:hypothetical protein
MAPGQVYDIIEAEGKMPEARERGFNEEREAEVAAADGQSLSVYIRRN